MDAETKAREIADEWEPHLRVSFAPNGAALLTYAAAEALTDAITQALRATEATAHAQGRAEGLEEAAAIAHAEYESALERQFEAKRQRDVVEAYGEFYARSMAHKLADRFRALAQGIEARSGETAQPARSVGREPGPEGDALDPRPATPETGGEHG
jgi:hypothetical protein